MKGEVTLHQELVLHDLEFPVGVQILKVLILSNLEQNHLLQVLDVVYILEEILDLLYPVLDEDLVLVIVNLGHGLDKTDLKDRSLRASYLDQSLQIVIHQLSH